MGEPLKPCPFCGEEPELTEASPQTFMCFSVCCRNKKCLAAPGVHVERNRKKCVKAWNTRVPPPPSTGEMG